MNLMNERIQIDWRIPIYLWPNGRRWPEETIGTIDIPHIEDSRDIMETTEKEKLCIVKYSFENETKSKNNNITQNFKTRKH